MVFPDIFYVNELAFGLFSFLSFSLHKNNYLGSCQRFLAKTYFIMIESVHKRFG